jgi:hypothetical protein
MTTEHDPRTRIVLSWLREDAHENPEHMLLRALDEVDATPQRRAWWPARRFTPMNSYVKLIVAAAAVLVVAVVGYQLLPRNGGVGGAPSVEPSPSPPLLARGNFNVDGRAVELDAAGAGSSVTGTMSATNDDGSGFTIDPQCTLTTEGGLILIGGDVAASTTDYAPADTWAGLVLQRGSPMRGVFVFQLDDPRAASCPAFLEQMIAITEPDGGLEASLRPIEGTVELGP